MVGVVAAAAELVPALGAAEVHAAAFSQSVLEPAVRTGYKKTTQGKGQIKLLMRGCDRTGGNRRMTAQKQTNKNNNKNQEK